MTTPTNAPDLEETARAEKARFLETLRSSPAPQTEERENSLHPLIGICGTEGTSGEKARIAQLEIAQKRITAKSKHPLITFLASAAPAEPPRPNTNSRSPRPCSAPQNTY